MSTTANLNSTARPEHGRPIVRPPPARHKRPALPPSLAGGVVALVVAGGCIALGNWQYAKFERKEAAQAQLDRRAADAPITLGGTPVSAEALRARPVVVRGRFEAGRQFLVDNRIHREQAGYHVVTPLQIEGSEMRVLVNRGWVPALARHSDVPAVATPGGTVELHGIAVVPGSRFFTLGSEADSGWQPVWQNLDLARFPAWPATRCSPWCCSWPPTPAGFVRDWPRPDDRKERHLSYALQWYGLPPPRPC
jgi:surfeit locus 1 family protein